MYATGNNLYLRNNHFLFIYFLMSKHIFVQYESHNIDLMHINLTFLILASTAASHRFKYVPQSLQLLSIHIFSLLFLFVTFILFYYLS